MGNTDIARLRKALVDLDLIATNFGDTTALRVQDAFQLGGCISAGDLRLVIDAARSTLPKTKFIDTWNVEYAYIDSNRKDWHPGTLGPYLTEDEAQSKSLALLPPSIYSIVRVTGPHRHEVPA